LLLLLLLLMIASPQEGSYTLHNSFKTQKKTLLQKSLEQHWVFWSAGAASWGRQQERE
jgi:hypothetical protein